VVRQQAIFPTNGKTACQMNHLFELLGFLIVLIQLYRWLYRMWLQRWMNSKKSAKLPRKPRVWKPKTDRDCPVCQQHKSKAAPPAQLPPVAWSTRKGRGSPRKKISTQGFACSNPLCNYHGIRDEAIHALVGDGTHGKHAAIQDLKCQACGKKFTVRRNTETFPGYGCQGLVVVGSGCGYLGSQRSFHRARADHPHLARSQRRSKHEDPRAFYGPTRSAPSPTSGSFG
jgi:hypothetical protein